MPDCWTHTCRRRFSKADFDFLAEALAPQGTRRQLQILWDDPASRHELLDLNDVLRHLLDSPAALQVSPGFYFYVLVRHGFLRAGLTDADLADYVASVLASRVSPAGHDLLQHVTRGFTHTSQFLPIISRSRGRMRFHLQVAAGNQFLVLTGLYPDFLRKRASAIGEPDLAFYESFASRAYLGAADHDSPTCPASRRLLGKLAESLPQARRSLNRIAEELVFLGE